LNVIRICILCLIAIQSGAALAGMGATVSVRIVEPLQRPQIISVLPADGGTISNSHPILEVTFDMDMDVSRTNVQKIILPAPLIITGIAWKNARTVAIQYIGDLTTAGAKRIDLVDFYWANKEGYAIPVGGGSAFFFAVNQSPAITPSIKTPTTTGTGVNVSFSVTATDADGDSLSYAWSFGDNATATGQTVTHAYVTVGSYTATVTVSDGKGGSVQGLFAVNVVDGGGKPVMVDSLPKDGASVSGSRPPFRVLFGVDMNTAKLDVSQVGLPAGLTITGIRWPDAKTLEILYDGQLASFGAKRVDLMDGYFVNTVGQSIPFGSGFAFAYIDPNTKPFIAVAPSANPPAALANNPVQFAVTAIDPDGDALSYAWEFGDGTKGDGAAPLHTYAAAGPFVATVSVADGKGGTASASVLLSAPVVVPWTVTKTGIGLNFKSAGADKIGVSGTVVLAAGFNPANKKVSVNFGGNVQTFTLSDKGTAKIGKDSFKLTRKLSKNVFLGGAASIQFTLTGALAAKLVDEGLTNEDTPKAGIRRTIDIVMTLDGTPYSAQAAVLYSAKANSSGKAK